MGSFLGRGEREEEPAKMKRLILFLAKQVLMVSMKKVSTPQ